MFTFINIREIQDEKKKEKRKRKRARKKHATTQVRKKEQKKEMDERTDKYTDKAFKNCSVFQNFVENKLSRTNISSRNLGSKLNISHSQKREN
jgi:hypothetical protein